MSTENRDGQALAARWDKLVEAFTGGHEGLRDGAQKVWGDFANLPAGQQKEMQPFKDAMSSEVTEFYAKAKACGKRK